MSKLRKLATGALCSLLAAGMIGCSTVPSSSGDASAAPTQEQSSADPSATPGATSQNQDKNGSKNLEQTGDPKTDADLDDEDKKNTWNTMTPSITLEGTSISSSDSSVTLDGSQATITAGGTYVVSGSLTDGQLVVDAPETETVQLVLNGATLNSSTGSPLVARQADKLILTLADGTQNAVSDAQTYSDTSDGAPDAAIWSEASLSINGNGSLKVDASYNDGIYTKDDLRIASGTIDVTATDHAIRGKDSVGIADGTFTINAGKDGIQSDKDTQTDKGWVAIDDGTFNITAGDDAVSAETRLTINGGEFNAVTGGGSENSTKDHSEFGFGGQGADFFDGEFPFDEGDFHFDQDDWGEFGGPRGGHGRRGFNSEDAPIPSEDPDAQDANANINLAATPTASATSTPEKVDKLPGAPADSAADAQATQSPEKVDQLPGAPADSDGTQRGEHPSRGDRAEGSIATTSTDADGKGLTCNGDIDILGGTFELNCAGDGVNGEQNVQISGATMKIASGDDAVHADAELKVNADVEITDCYEGLEGVTILVEGGNIILNSADDGINANGSRNEGTKIQITGGHIEAICGGDGMDTAGDIEITGGETKIFTPQANAHADQALDYEGNLTVSDGTLIAGGASVGWGPGSESEQSYIYSSGNFAANTAISIRENGSEVYTFTPSVECAHILVSFPGIKADTSYDVYEGETLVGSVTSGEGGSGMTGGFGERGNQMRPDGDSPEAPPEWDDTADGTRPGRPGRHPANEMAPDDSVSPTASVEPAEPAQ